MFDNREHALWKDPFTGAVSNDGFWERYGKALARTDAALAAFDRDDFDVEAARAITGDLDFSGEPTTARIVAVEDGAAGGRAGNERAEGASGAGSGRAAGTAGVGEGPAGVGEDPAGTGAPGPDRRRRGPGARPHDGRLDLPCWKPSCPSLSGWRWPPR